MGLFRSASYIPPMSLTVADLLASPDHYLHSFEGDDALFMPMDRDAYRRSIFLDGRIEPARSGVMRVPTALLMGARPRAQATNWIFHVAHCGSTLLARALDAGATHLTLREPLALRQAAVANSPPLLALAIATASKRYAAHAPTLVKANVPVNFVLPAIADSSPGHRALFLFWDLREYLLAILRSDNHREWLRRVTSQLAPALGDLDGQPDAVRAAALWLAQIERYAAALPRFADARALDAQRFFAEPAAVLAGAAAFFGLDLDPEAIRAQIEGPLFGRYSKNPDMPFSNDERLARRAAAEAELAGELEAGASWVAARGDAAPRALATLSASIL